MMTPELWKDVREHLAACLELTGEERAAHLGSLANLENGARIRREVESLLDESTSSPGFLEQPPFAQDRGKPPGRIGRYAIQREIGRGGMGTVYYAIRDDDEYQAEVAIKVLAVGLDSDFFARRLRFERQLLAFLNHPSIVRLLDGGATGDGRPYLVTEYVEGESLLSWCRERNLGLEERLRLFLPICDAVHYAHQNLIIHCDLKPGNVMVNRQGIPKLLDFGIAKLLAPGQSHGNTTASGFRMLSIPYASPEQIRGGHVTTATDVYSLGCTLFEMVTGVQPFSADRPHTSLDNEPPVASARTAGAGFPVHQNDLRGDVDNVVRKAMDPSPHLRYESAEQLAADIRRYLSHQPVLARPLTRGYRWRKFAQRNRPLLAGLSATAAAIIIGAIVAGLGWREAARERDHARRLYENAHELARAFVFELDDTLQSDGATGARKLIVERGLASLDKLAAESGDDEEVRRELPAAYLKLGDVLGRQGSANVGRTAEAQQSYERALDFARAHLSSHPDDREMQRTAASLSIRLSGVLKIQGRTQDALVHGREARRILEARASQPDATLADRRSLAAAYQDLGGTYAQLGEWKNAASVRQTGLALLEQVASDPAAGVNDRVSVVLGRMRYGGSLSRAGLYQDAGAQLDRAEAEARSLRRPDLISSAVFAAGMGLGLQKRWREALGRFEESWRMRDQMTAADPADWRMKSLAAASLARAGEARAANGDFDGGLRYLERSFEIRRELARADSSNTGAQVELAESHAFLGDAWRSRDPARAGSLASCCRDLRALRCQPQTGPGADRTTRGAPAKAGALIGSRGYALSAESLKTGWPLQDAAEIAGPVQWVIPSCGSPSARSTPPSATWLGTPPKSPSLQCAPRGAARI
jgi:tetratricopeptide (TPR) repeat protein